MHADVDEISRWKTFEAEHKEYKDYKMSPWYDHGSHFARLVEAIHERSKRFGLPFNLYHHDVFRTIDKWITARRGGYIIFEQDREKILAVIMKTAPIQDEEERKQGCPQI